MSQAIPNIKLSGKVIPASRTNVAAHDGVLTFSREGQRFRLDVVLGYVAGTPDFLLQHASLPGHWSDVKTAITATASAGTVCTFTAGSNRVTSTAHGCSPGEFVGFYATAGELPPGVSQAMLYKVSEVPDANTLVVMPYSAPGMGNHVPEVAGAGTYRVVPATSVSITLNPEVAADQTFLPIRHAARVLATTGGGEIAQVLAIFHAFSP